MSYEAGEAIRPAPNRVQAASPHGSWPGSPGRSGWCGRLERRFLRNNGRTPAAAATPATVAFPRLRSRQRHALPTAPRANPLARAGNRGQALSSASRLGVTRGRRGPCPLALTRGIAEAILGSKFIAGPAVPGSQKSSHGRIAADVTAAKTAKKRSGAQPGVVATPPVCQTGGVPPGSLYAPVRGFCLFGPPVVLSGLEPGLFLLRSSICRGFTGSSPVPPVRARVRRGMTRDPMRTDVSPTA